MAGPAQVARLWLVVGKAEPAGRLGRQDDAPGRIRRAQNDAELLSAPVKGRHGKVGVVVDEEALETLRNRPDGRIVKTQAAGPGIELDDGLAEDRATERGIGAV